MHDPQQTIAGRLHARLDDLTRAERQLAESIRKAYPVSGLGSITRVAQAAEVSTPTVARMVQKLGFKGYAEVQVVLRAELEARVSGPVARRIHVLGGRITRMLAEYLALHLQMVRPGVVPFRGEQNTWAHSLLDLAPGDVLVIFDVRRYENATLRLAEMAAERDAEIMLFTDQWRSPVHRLARAALVSRTVVLSASDCSVTTLLLVETVIAAVQERRWPDTRARMEALDEMSNRTGFFRKFT